MMSHKAKFIEQRNLPYTDGITLQKKLLTLIANSQSSPAAVLFVEHNPVITCGRSGDGTNLLVPTSELQKAGIEFHPAGRGGDVTYHGPGQWTVYPILRLDWYERNLHRYLRLLEECVIHFLDKYGIKGGRREGLTGAWVDFGKVAAVGVAVSRWVTWHGFALNICTDLNRFTQFMHPCGITADQGAVASLSSITGKRYDMDEVLPNLRDAVAEVLELEWTED